MCIGLLIVLLSMHIVSAENTNATNSLTGKAITQVVDVSVQVVVGQPYISVYSPKNLTYIKDLNLLLNISANNYQKLWYNLDNGTNITLSNKIAYFNATGIQKNHTLFLFANNTEGVVIKKSVNFAVNVTKFFIEYEHYRNETIKGNSTDFNSYSFEELQNLSNIVLENTQKGKIYFTSQINITALTSNNASLDAYINISHNYISINDTALQPLNTTATLSLYNLSFTNPRLIRNGEVCPDYICTLENYTSGVLRFNVTHFSSYSSEETSESSSAGSSTTGSTTTSSEGGSSGGGGGGEGGGESKESITLLNFTLEPERIKFIIKQGGTEHQIIKLTNIEKEKITLKIKMQALEPFIKLSATEVALTPGETKIIDVDAFVREDAKPDVTLGKIIITSGELQKEILVVIESQMKRGLFDVRVEIPKEFLTVKKGSDLPININLYNLGDIGRIDANITYVIKNDANKEVATSQETLAVETQASFIKTLAIPSSIPDGNYIVYVRADYQDTSAGASAFFTVKSSSETLSQNIFIFLGGALLLLIISIYILLHFEHGRKQSFRRVSK